MAVISRTPDEIKKGLQYCMGRACGTIKLDCPYEGERSCHDKVLADALALIQQLEADNAKKDETIQMLQDGIDQWEMVAASPGAVEDLAREADRLDERVKQLETDNRQLEGLLNHMNQLRDAAAGRALKLEERVHQLEAERDAAVEDIELCDACETCKHYEADGEDNPCRHCFHINRGRNSYFEWRGVHKEE